MAYVAQRCIERARGGGIDPTLVVVQYHTPYYWRSANAAWWGVLAAVVVYAVALRRPGATTRALVIATPICAALAVVLSWVFP
jgi:hypothetical protein